MDKEETKYQLIKYNIDEILSKYGLYHDIMSDDLSDLITLIAKVAYKKGYIDGGVAQLTRRREVMKNKTPKDKIEQIILDHFPLDGLPNNLTNNSTRLIMEVLDGVVERAEKLAIYNYTANILAENYCSELDTYDFDGIAAMVLNEENK